jgi:hypothetical protein
MSFAAINYLAVIVATIVAFFIGAIWYSALFRTQWMAAVGATAGAAAKPPTPLPQLLVINAVGNLILSFILSALLHSLGSASFGGGIAVGFLVWLGFIATVLTVNNTFANRPAALSLIDGGYWLVVLIVDGAIIGLFG